MPQSQYFVLSWIYFALVAAALLQVARLAVNRLKQPTDRIRVIHLSLIGVTAIPLLLAMAPWTVYRFPVVTSSENLHTSSLFGSLSAPVDRTDPARSGEIANFAHDVTTPIADSPVVTTGAAPQRIGSVNVIVANEVQPKATEYVKATVRRTVWDLIAVAIIVIISAATIVFLLECCLGVYWLAKMTRSASAPSQEIQGAWNCLTKGRARHVRLLITEAIDVPIMFGCLQPVVMLPKKMNSADPSTLDFCLSHEWCHIERRDILSWHAVRACQCLLWFLPSYWALRTELRLQQDLLADDRSTRSKQDAVEYSELLLGFAQERLSIPMAGALTFSDRPTQLTKRINMLLENPTVIRFQSSWQFNLTAASVAIIAVMLVGGIRLEASPADDAKADSKQTQAETKPPATASTNESQVTDTKTQPADKSTEAKIETPKDTEDNPTLKYHCSVVSKTTGQGIPNARVTVRRSVLNSQGNRIIEESRHVTGADGKYEVTIPPDQVAVAALYIELDVDHDDYSAKKGFGYALSMIRKNEKMGERPFFEKTELYPAEAVTGTIVSPDGKPLSGIKVQSYSMASRRDFESGSFNDTVTDSQGHFRINLHKDADGVLWIIPKDFASIEKFLAKQRGDLGTIKLTDGVRVSGQVTSAEGKPLAGLAVNIDFAGERDVGGLPVATSIERGAISDSEGRFAFDPLPPGEYVVTPAEHLGDPLNRDRSIYEVPGVFVRQKVAVKDGAKTQSVTVQAVPHVVLKGQIYDSKGAKRRGHEFHVFGQFDGGWWYSIGRPDKDGAFATRIPHGLQKTRVQISCNEHQALRYRRGKDQPVENRNVDGVDFGTLNDDVEGFEIIYYQAPVVLISTVDEEQKPVSGMQVAATYSWGEQRYVLKGELRSDLHFEHQADGRYRTSQMLPDEDVTFKITAPGYESTTKTVKLAEGETNELVVTMKKESSDKSKVDGAKN